MAVVIDATPKGAAANSYDTLANAETYFEGRLNTSDWDDATEDQQNRALVQATNRLEQEDFEGLKTTSDQRLKWPRNGLVDERGDSADEDTVPERVKHAQFELALAMLGTDLLADTGLEGFQSVKVGPLDVTPRHMQQAGELPENVRRELSLWMVSPSSANVNLVRA